MVDYSDRRWQEIERFGSIGGRNVDDIEQIAFCIQSLVESTYSPGEVPRVIWSQLRAAKIALAIGLSELKTLIEMMADEERNP